ncbi:hypothetical protein ACNCTE_005117, partial [Escherichia coli]
KDLISAYHSNGEKLQTHDCVIVDNVEYSVFYSAFLLQVTSVHMFFGSPEKMSAITEWKASLPVTVSYH